MKKYIKKLWKDLLNDEKVGKRVTAAILLGAATGCGSCVALVEAVWAKVVFGMLAAILGTLAPLVVADNAPEAAGSNQPKAP